MKANIQNLQKKIAVYINTFEATGKTLYSLPDELIITIALYFNLADIAAFRCSSRRAANMDLSEALRQAPLRVSSSTDYFAEYIRLSMYRNESVFNMQFKDTSARLIEACSPKIPSLPEIKIPPLEIKVTVNFNFAITKPEVKNSKNFCPIL